MRSKTPHSNRGGPRIASFSAVQRLFRFGAGLASRYLERHVYRTIVILLVLLVGGAQNTAWTCGACCFMQAKAAECPHEAEPVSPRVGSLNNPCGNDSVLVAIDPEVRRESTPDSFDVDVHQIDDVIPQAVSTHAPQPPSTPPDLSPRTLNLRI